MPWPRRRRRGRHSGCAAAAWPAGNAAFERLGKRIFARWWARAVLAKYTAEEKAALEVKATAYGALGGRREQENAACAGGLRAPWKTTRRWPRLCAVMQRVRAAIRGLLQEQPGVAGKLLGEGAGGWAEVERAHVARRLASVW